ncbi:WbqC family protein [Evansella clarkii]|uniref:WbqC family protein n=1 Tax=Evansella clarkii TaxID=79879 RepID=UPI0009970246|nr:WbqC family protein [Evansella clarkii]
MQPYFFPYIGYWQLIYTVNTFVIYDDVNYKKAGWINRNRILTNGESKLISLPVKKASQNKLINQLDILGDDVNEALIKTIMYSYYKAPYFSEVFPLIQNIINYNEKNLAVFLENLIRRICDYLSIDTQIIVSSAVNKNNSLHGQDKIIDIIKTLNGEEYINPSGGVHLYSQLAFSNNNIKLKFLKSRDLKYKQFKNTFNPNLSIIDVLMFNSKKDVYNMLSEFSLSCGGNYE